MTKETIKKFRAVLGVSVLCALLVLLFLKGDTPGCTEPMTEPMQSIDIIREPYGEEP